MEKLRRGMGVGRGGRSRVLGLPSLTERVGVGRRSLPAPSPETILPGAVLFELPHRHLLAGKDLCSGNAS